MSDLNRAGGSLYFARVGFLAGAGGLYGDPSKQTDRQTRLELLPSLNSFGERK